jgi:N-acetylmuramate 1-kinase
MDKIKSWLSSVGYEKFEISEASADASFRKYYRLKNADESFILMDSSLELASLAPFVDVTRRLLDAGVKAPRIFEKNEVEGFLILEDFGNALLLGVLTDENFKTLYLGAIDEIVKTQKADVENLPLYDKAFLRFEMDLMGEWYLTKKLGLALSAKQKTTLENSLNAIADVVLSQPQGIFVHRDFHSRNVMLTPDGEIGVIDYQDAMNGAITYDLVSLLKDCYIEYAREDVEALALAFRDKIELGASDEEFLKWFDFMGLQRHVKVLGVFSRLHLRDGKDGYLKDIPLTLKYTIETARRYDETKALAAFLSEATS